MSAENKLSIAASRLYAAPSINMIIEIGAAEPLARAVTERAVVSGISNKIYRVGMNVLARGMQSMMRVHGGVDGFFCVGPATSFYELDGLRFVYHFSQYGAGGNIDSGGNTESETREKLFSLLKNDSVFYDVGSHEGLYAISFKKKFQSATVYTFEPHPEALLENLTLNGLEDVAVFRVALGHEVGMVVMTTKERSSNYVALNDNNQPNTPMTTLDKIIADKALKQPDAIKLDIEGFELQALRGASAALTSSHPIVITEINHCFLRYHKDLGEFIDFMASFGFGLHSLNNGVLNPIKTTEVHVLSDLPPSADYNYWWLPPTIDIARQ